MLLIGCGKTMEPLSADTRKFFAEQNMPHDVMTTSAAIHIYNVVLAEGRRVAAALVSVADATT